MTIIIAVAVVLGAVVFAYQRNQKLQSNGEQLADENSPIVYQDDGFIRLKVDVGPDILIDNRDGSVKVSKQFNWFNINEMRLFVKERREEDVKQWITDRRVEDTGAAQGIYPYERIGVPIELYGLPASLWVVTSEPMGAGGRPRIKLDDKFNNRLLTIDFYYSSILDDTLVKGELAELVTSEAVGLFEKIKLSKI